MDDSEKPESDRVRTEAAPVSREHTDNREAGSGKQDKGSALQRRTRGGVIPSRALLTTTLFLLSVNTDNSGFRFDLGIRAVTVCDPRVT